MASWFARLMASSPVASGWVRIAAGMVRPLFHLQSSLDMQTARRFSINGPLAGRSRWRVRYNVKLPRRLSEIGFSSYVEYTFQAGRHRGKFLLGNLNVKDAGTGPKKHVVIIGRKVKFDRFTRCFVSDSGRCETMYLVVCFDVNGIRFFIFIPGK
ncbi:hypothetical protein [Massilia aquatica]|uniref:Uncharacterized protein n=1 Tax=Massilia aquatica TaxID=2609000 RepID=A0ABX0MI47_9BURK|nr:hypothetical protein [Massilia aquatica]NHZ43531.1 hypothetical protein [Massilia aquatica]